MPDEPPSWKGRPLLVGGKAVMNELHDLGIDLLEVQSILEEGFDCASGNRGKGSFERCIERKGRMLKVVVADCGDYFLLVHAGSVRASRRKMRQVRR